MKKENFTTYNIAAHWLDCGLVLCNDIVKLDESVWKNCRFELDESTEIYQWFLTSLSENDVEYLEKTFGLLFSYSEKLDCFILCVDHWGTMWEGVPCQVLSDDWVKFNSDLLITKENPNPKMKKTREF